MKLVDRKKNKIRVFLDTANMHKQPAGVRYKCDVFLLVAHPLLAINFTLFILSSNRKMLQAQTINICAVFCLPTLWWASERWLQWTMAVRTSCNSYGVNWTLKLAVIGLETGFALCRQKPTRAVLIEAGSSNAGGWRKGSPVLLQWKPPSSNDVLNFYMLYQC